MTKNFRTPHMIRNAMVHSFCSLELPQPSYHPINTLQVFYEICFCAKFYNGFVLKISTYVRDYAGFSPIGSHLLFLAELKAF